MNFTFENDCIGYDLSVKSDQGLVVKVCVDEQGDTYLVQMDNGDAGEVEATCDNLRAIAVMIGGEWKTLRQIKKEAESQFPSLLAEHKQEQADEEAHMRELRSRWGE